MAEHFREHFSEWQWAGFISGALAPEAAQELRAHLARGCATCVQEQAFWRQLGTALRPGPDPVPLAALQRVLELPRRMRPLAPQLSPGRAAARMIFDSFLAPVPSTVRGLQAQRHCVYELGPGAEAGAASLEVMTERVSRLEDWSVVGQLLTAGGEGCRDCVIELKHEDGAAPQQSARTNAFGEFSFVHVGVGPWCLDLQAGEKKWSIAPLLLP